MTAIPKTSIKVETTVFAPIEKVWKQWIDPKHIVRWNFASDDWHTPRAQNDLRPGGKFLFRMESKDGKMGFDFEGEYRKVDTLREINYILADDRKVQIFFASEGNQTRVSEIFEAENTNSAELQELGWQAILNNFKKHAESSGRFEILHFDILIGASPEKVYKTVIDKTQYTEWTSEFNPTSCFKGSWDKGSKITFLGTDENGSQGGMVSRIKENIPERFISIEHLGVLKNGEEIMTGQDVDLWAGATENYTFTPHKGKTLFEVNIDTNADFKAYFSETWPKALNKLKSICEQ